jgi:spore maturation protein CgeB
MRALVIHPGPAFSVADVYQGYVSGLRANGVEVAEYNLNDRLTFYDLAHVHSDGGYVKAFCPEDAVRMAAASIKSACYDFWPDVLVVISAFFVPVDFYEVFRKRGHKVVIVHTEEPYEFDTELKRAGFADLNVLNDPTHIDAFQKVAPTIYVPHGYDPARHHPRGSEPSHDFCFVGTGYPSRIEFFEQVDWSGIDAAFAGHWQRLTEDSPLRSFVVHPLQECYENEEAVSLYTSSKCSANLYRRESLRPELSAGWAIGPREVELAACGVPFLREARGEGDELFPMLPTFTSPQEFEDLLRFWLRNDEERELAAKKAMQAVSERTFEKTTRRVLDALN